MRRKRALIVTGVIAAVLALIVGGLYWAGRSLFYEPTARGVDSVIGELGGTRVLGVFAHPDDEQTVNGLFWRAKDRDGAYTAMITATRGEAGHQSPTVGRQEDLGDIRKAEALKNSFNLGVDRHVVWDYPDGGVPESDADEIVARIVEELLLVEPDVVVAFWPESGATGHADHMEMGALAERAIGPRGTDPGLGLVTRSIIDQHFSERDRAGRLIRAVLADGRRTGYGIDEDTALVLEGGTSHVLGSGTVTVIEPGGRLRRHGTGETVAAAHTRS